MKTEKRATNLVQRLLAMLLCLTMVIGLAPGFTLRSAEEADGGVMPLNATEKVIDRYADGNTTDTYMDFLNLAENSRFAGRVWTDKTVFSKETVEGNQAVVDEKPLSFPQSGDQDFLAVFSALGSNQVVNGKKTIPLDVVFVVDISSWMLA